MRKALVIGIDYYKNADCLHGCVNDAQAVANLLAQHENGVKNFDVKTILNKSKKSFTSKADIFTSIHELFECSGGTVLLYFSGHGGSNQNYGFLAPSEYDDITDGIGMDLILSLANGSKAENKIIILDCCHAGKFGTLTMFNNTAMLNEGVTILSACTASESAMEIGGSGLFTHLLIDALSGSAADLIGQISPSGIYAHIDQSLSAWEQRPVFKTNVKKFISLRSVEPSISIPELKNITNLFSTSSYKFQLDKSYEETMPNAKKENIAKFKLLQKMFKVNLVRPIGEEYMYYAAINSKKCKLTALGVHYWNLVNKKRI